MSETKLTKAQKRVLKAAHRAIFDAPYGTFIVYGKKIAHRVGLALLEAGLIERGVYLGSGIYEMRRTASGDAALAKSTSPEVRS